MPTKLNGKGKQRKSILTPEEAALLAPILHQSGTITRLKLRDLNIDWDYQTRPRERIANNIEHEFYEAWLDVFLVAQRPDGKYWIYDGVTRKDGLMRRGESEREVDCKVFQSTGQAQEAQMFALTNSRRLKEFIRKETALHSYGVAGTDKGFEDAIEACGYTLNGKGKRNLRGPSYVEKAWKLDYDPKHGVMVKALNSIRESWKDRHRVYGYMVLAIAILYDSQPRAIDEQVRKQLHNHPPDEIIEHVKTRWAKTGAKALRIHPGDMPLQIARWLADNINKHPGKSGRLDVSRLNETYTSM
jgi:hypothetical protein